MITLQYGPLVKRFNTAAFHAVIQGFESPTGHHMFYSLTVVGAPAKYSEYASEHKRHFVGMWRLSSAGRASALQAEGRRFDPVSLHHLSGAVVKLEFTPVCHTGGRGFESRQLRHSF